MLLTRPWFLVHLKKIIPAAAAAATTALLLALLLALAPAGAHAARRRHLHQSDASVRQENVHHNILKSLRAGGGADEAASSLGDQLGGQNFEKRASWRTINNLRMNMGRYARSGDPGVRGSLAGRIGSKRDYNDSGDIEDSNYYLEQAGQKSTRSSMLADEMDRARARKLGSGGGSGR